MRLAPEEGTRNGLQVLLQCTKENVKFNCSLSQHQESDEREVAESTGVSRQFQGSQRGGAGWSQAGSPLCGRTTALAERLVGQMQQLVTRER